MKWLVGILASAMSVAYITHYVFENGVIAFCAAAVALIILSKVMGDAAEQLSTYTGGSVAGLIYVSSSNLGEIIVLAVAVSAGMLELVQAGIVGSMIGNILFVLGCTIYSGCRKNGTLTFNKETGKLYVEMFFIVASILMLTTLFENRIPDNRMVWASYGQAIVLIFVYVYFYRLSRKDPRFKEINEDMDRIEQKWSKKASILILMSCALATVSMSEVLVQEVSFVATALGIPRLFIGYGLFPFFGNVAEHVVAITSAMKKRVELSIAIAVGSATQVGMVVTPVVVFFGFITGKPVILNFSGIPWGLLVLSLVGGSVAINEGRLTIEKGVMLLAFYVTSMYFFLLVN